MKDLRALVGDIQKIVGTNQDRVYGSVTAAAILRHLDSTCAIPVSLTQRTKAIQNLVGVKKDGLFGPVTAQAVLLALGQNGVEEAPASSVETGVFDDRTEKNLATLDPKAQPLFRKFTAKAKATAGEMGYDVRAISGHRTWAQQDALYAKGRTAPGQIVTKARGGFSNHNFGIAVDYGVFKGATYVDNANPTAADGVYRAIAKHAASCGIEWGGSWSSFRDLPHFEVKTGLTMSQKRTKYKAMGSVL